DFRNHDLFLLFIHPYSDEPRPSVRYGRQGRGLGNPHGRVWRRAVCLGAAPFGAGDAAWNPLPRRGWLSGMDLFARFFGPGPAWHSHGACAPYGPDVLPR